jgi:hypothetical protein
VHGCGDASCGFSQAVGRVCGISDDESRRAGALSVPRQRVDEDAGLSDPFGKVGVVDLVGVVGQGDQQVEVVIGGLERLGDLRAARDRPGVTLSARASLDKLREVIGVD